MAAIVQHRRGTTAAVNATLAAAGEILQNNEDQSLHVGDAITLGGWIVGGNPVTANSGTSFAIVGAHQGRLITLSNAAPVAVSLPQAIIANNFSLGAKVLVFNRGAGLVTITPTTSTINGAASLALASGVGAYIISDGVNYLALPFSGAASVSLAGLSDVALASLANYDTLVYDSGTSKWVNRRAKYVIGSSSSGVLTASQNLLLHRVAKGVTFPANFGAYLGLTSQAGGTANATASTVVNVDKAGTATPNSFSNVGTITIGAGSVVPTFATSGGVAQTFAAGDVLRIQAPGTPDATFAGFYSTLVGFET